MDYSLLGRLCPRYLRRVGDDRQENGQEVKLGDRVLSKVRWAEDLFCIPGVYALRNTATDTTEDYRSKGYYPMDAASCIAIAVLGSGGNTAVKVLDLCCCPGSKLQLLAEKLPKDSTVVGVDISEKRLNVCRSLMMSWDEPCRKFCSAGPARKLIFQCDGTTFGPSAVGKLVYDSCLIDEEIQQYGALKKRNKSYRDREGKRLKKVEGDIFSGVTPECTMENFDFVLVDAECTHDASYKHMQYISIPDAETTSTADDVVTPGGEPAARLKSGAQLSHYSGTTASYHGTSAVVTSASPELTALQRGLLMNGFERLRPGGCLVYSTCSQDAAQNEEVVRCLLDTVGAQAELLSVPDIMRALLEASVQEGGKSVRGDDKPEGKDGSAQPLAPSLQLMQLDLPALSVAVRRDYATPEALTQLSEEICRDAAALTSPIFFESAILPGTLRLSYKGAMSGHFIAKIRKKV